MEETLLKDRQQVVKAAAETFDTLNSRVGTMAPAKVLNISTIERSIATLTDSIRELEGIRKTVCDDFRQTVDIAKDAISEAIVDEVSYEVRGISQQYQALYDFANQATDMLNGKSKGIKGQAPEPEPVPRPEPVPKPHADFDYEGRDMMLRVIYEKILRTHYNIPDGYVGVVIDNALKKTHMRNCETNDDFFNCLSEAIGEYHRPPVKQV